MIRKLWPIFVRDLVLLTRGAQGRGGAVLPLLFFLAVAMLFPFAVGPDARLLARTGAGVIWVAALLAAILPLDRLVEPDVEAGMFDQWALRGIAEEALLMVRILAHWLSFGVPLMLAAPISAGLLGLDGQQLWTVEIGLLLGTPGLAAIGVTIAALTAALARCLGGGWRPCCCWELAALWHWPSPRSRAVRRSGPDASKAASRACMPQSANSLAIAPSVPNSGP